MGQVRFDEWRTDAMLASHARACAAYAAFSSGVRFAPERAGYFRKLRAPSQEPNPLARVMAHISEAKRHGAPEGNARAIATALLAHIDAEYGAGRAWSRDVVLAAHHAENEQNAAEPAVIMDGPTPTALRAYAKATRHAAVLGLIAADAADLEASRRQHHV